MSFYNLLRRKTKDTEPGTARRKRSGRNGLFVIALLLALSGTIRLGLQAGSAFANVSSSGEYAARSGDTGSCSSDDIAAVLSALDVRESRIAERESRLADRMQALSVAETQVSKSLSALEGAEQKLAATMAIASTAAEEDLQKLTAVYENMKPKQAAPVFAAMDPQFAAGFLGRMRPDSAAAILAGLDPEAAYAISALLAGRNADAPTQ